MHTWKLCHEINNPAHAGSEQSHSESRLATGYVGRGANPAWQPFTSRAKLPPFPSSVSLLSIVSEDSSQWQLNPPPQYPHKHSTSHSYCRSTRRLRFWEEWKEAMECVIFFPQHLKPVDHFLICSLDHLQILSWTHLGFTWPGRVWPPKILGENPFKERPLFAQLVCSFI